MGRLLLLWAGVSMATVYRDGDGDGYGDPSRPADGEEPRSGYVSNSDDCNDRDASTHPGAGEWCDGQDNDCDSRIDEANALGCAVLYPDTDEDGYGAVDESVCVCVSDDSAAATIDGVIHRRHSGDCDDGDSTIHPRSCADGLDDDLDGLIDDADPDCAAGRDELGTAPAAPRERLDGHDTDCDGVVPFVELDCDGDGAMALLPSGLGADEGYDDYRDLGLAPCEEAAQAAVVSCWSADIEIACEPLAIRNNVVIGSGLWGLSIAQQPERFDGGRRTLLLTDGDCDDDCAERHPEAAEACDGLDTDCSGAVAADDDEDGLPDPGQPGTVSAAEVDADGDGLLDCAAFDPATQPYTAPGACSGEALRDGDCLEGGSCPVAAENSDDAVGPATACAAARAARAVPALAVIAMLVARRRRQSSM